MLRFLFIELRLIFILVVRGWFNAMFFFLFLLQSTKRAAVPGLPCSSIRVHPSRLICAKVPNLFSRKPHAPILFLPALDFSAAPVGSHSVFLATWIGPIHASIYVWMGLTEQGLHELLCSFRRLSSCDFPNMLRNLVGGNQLCS
jgi:hypothetical protein